MFNDVIGHQKIMTLQANVLKCHNQPEDNLYVYHDFTVQCKQTFTQRGQSHPGLCMRSLVSLCQKYITGVVIHMVVCANKISCCFRNKAVIEEYVSRTLVNTSADSGAMHRDSDTCRKSMGGHIFRLLASRQFPQIASGKKRKRRPLLAQVLRMLY